MGCILCIFTGFNCWRSHLKGIIWDEKNVIYLQNITGRLVRLHWGTGRPILMNKRSSGGVIRFAGGSLGLQIVNLTLSQHFISIRDKANIIIIYNSLLINNILFLLVIILQTFLKQNDNLIVNQLDTCKEHVAGPHILSYSIECMDWYVKYISRLINPVRGLEHWRGGSTEFLI